MIETPSWPGLTPTLAAALALDDEHAIERLVTTPALMTEARTSLPLARNMARKPATPEELKIIVMRRFPAFPQPSRTDAEMREFFGDYQDACADISADALERAMQAWVRLPTSEFLPKPGKLRELAMQQVTPGSRAVSIMSRASERSEELERERRRLAGEHHDFTLESVRVKRIPKTPEERARVATDLEQFREHQVQRAVDKPRPSAERFLLSQGKLAEGHAVTPEMLALMRRGAEDHEIDRQRVESHQATYDEVVRGIDVQREIRERAVAEAVSDLFL